MLNYFYQQELIDRDLYKRGLFVDALRVLITTVVLIGLLNGTRIEYNKAAIMGIAITSCSIGLLLWRWNKHKTSPLIESLGIAFDTFWLVSIGSLLNNHVLLVGLLLLQLLGVSFHHGFQALRLALITQVTFHIAADVLSFKGARNYLTFEFANFVYFIGALALTVLAWQKERNTNKQIMEHLTDNILKIKNTMEIRKVLNFWDNRLSPQEHLYKITLENIGMDGIFFAYQGNPPELIVGEIKNIEEPLVAEITNRASLDELTNLAKDGALFSTDFSAKELNNKLERLGMLWPGIQRKYSTFAGFPMLYKDTLLGLVLVFSAQPQVFTDQALLGFNKNIGKTLLALGNIQVNSSLPDNTVGEYLSETFASESHGKSLPLEMTNVVAVLLGHMFCADKCLIALFDEKSQELKINGAFGQLGVPVGSGLDLRATIIHQAVVLGEPVNLKQNDLAATKKFLGETVANLLCVPLRSKAKILGLICIINKKMELSGERVDFDGEDEQIMCSLADHVGVSLENREYFNTLDTSFLATIRAMVNALDARDPYTKGHSDQVAKYALMIGKELNLSETQLRNLHYAGILHDIGKIGVPENILHKPSNLTPEEYSRMKLHPYLGQQILRPVALFQNLLPAIYHHHERWDGQGYPDGLKEEEIPLEARIMAVADAFDAIVSHRIYRKSREKEMAINELIKCAGKQFDPQVVDAFLTALDKSELSKEELLHWKLDTIRDIYRDVIMAVTQCQLILADDEELTDILKTGEIKLEVFIRNNSDAPIVRKNVERVLEELTVDPKIQKNLLLCVSEVISNMLKHAQGGAMQIIVSPRKIWFIAKDRGEGIKLRDIPKATLKKGFSTKKSLGMGFSIMLELLDRVYLKTDEHGTTVVLEQKRF